MNSQAIVIVILTAFFQSLVTAAVALRFWARKIGALGYRADDYLVLVAAVNIQRNGDGRSLNFV